MRQDILGWRKYRYLKWSLIFGSLCIAVFASQYGNLAQPPNGGTWQGYALGTVAALLIFCAALLGVRKRSYRSRLGTVQGWVSAHAYFGIVILLVATLHSAGQVGWNIHTLAYALTWLVTVSGLYGAYAYLHLPRQLAANANGRPRTEWFEHLDQLDRRICEVAAQCDASLQAMALSALDGTRIGGHALAQLSGQDRSLVDLSPGGRSGTALMLMRNRDQAVVIDRLSRRIPAARVRAEADALNELLELFGRRQVVLRRIRHDIRLKGVLTIWRYIHIAATAALLVALLAHVLSVFVYW